VLDTPHPAVTTGAIETATEIVSPTASVTAIVETAVATDEMFAVETTETAIATETTVAAMTAVTATRTAARARRVPVIDPATDSATTDAMAAMTATTVAMQAA
jgi:hypothetical protein